LDADQGVTRQEELADILDLPVADGEAMLAGGAFIASTVVA
jgi:hypothetical protein